MNLFNNSLEDTADAIISRSTVDRFALIVSEDYAGFINSHPELFPFDKVRTTGIITERNGTDTFYHLTSTRNVQSILSNGLQISPNPNLTYGEGIYTYKDITKFSMSNGFEILRIRYSGKYYESLIRYDLDDERYQGECVLFPEYITGIELLSQSEFRLLTLMGNPNTELSEVAELIVQESLEERNAIVIDEEFEEFVRNHLNLFTKDLVLGNGILVVKEGPAIFYHQTPQENIQSILDNGLMYSVADNLTYGEGIYTYKDKSKFYYSPWDKIIEIEYDGFYYESLVRFDLKSKHLQGECVIFPAYIKSIKAL